MNGIGLNDSLATAAYSSQLSSVNNGVEVKSAAEVTTQTSSVDKVTLSQEALNLSATSNEPTEPDDEPVAETNNTGIEPPKVAPFNTGIEPPKPK
ncbi:hypothetical protein [Rheinheimera sp. MM224]|uniref:hypothetical protein n=1 Tax=Rheinheimera sp. MM224 TaxID=3019969 RepID=UPI0021F89E89|nr:hypothetical protein [Rheinheimera sp. MM224]CAI3795739.1 hypothetical protein JAMGFMIE_01393 [Rheinheimera sp. MM224]CAI3795901.1 hypothetical protein JAMGFMIE_01433 [Rheinheimera sp. MM224]